MTVEQLSAPWALLLVAGVLGVGAYTVAVTERVADDLLAGRSLDAGGAVAGPIVTARWLLRQQTVTTERPDRIGWVLAPAAYLGLAAGALTVVPLSRDVVVADVRTGIVVFGAAEALAIVAVFLHGWSPNSAFPLMSAYGFVAVALAYELLSMFVLIAAALPAESLSIGAIVESQRSLWNVVRQPLGLPLWLVVSLGVTFTGPLGVVDTTMLAGGGAAESSGMQRLVWSIARGGMLTVFAVAGAAVLLGGWHGPVLPGGLWMALKSAALLVLLVWLGARLAPWPPERFVPLAWGLLLPLAFLHLLLAGVVAL